MQIGPTSSINENSLHVLVCPLDWGLGHATRCTPVIHELLSQGYRVTLAAGGAAKAFLKTEFPNLPLIDLPGFTPIYPTGKGMVRKMTRAIPAFLKGIQAENKALDSIFTEHNFDIIISDNRYGIWNRKSYNILIIHQLMIKTPRWLQWIEPFLWVINRILMKNFDRIWVPDYKSNQNLSGDLSHKYSIPEKLNFIGPLSRFTLCEDSHLLVKKNGILAMVSGPEPGRSIFAEILEKQLSKTRSQAILVLGKPDKDYLVKKTGNLTIYTHLDSQTLFNKIRESQLVISRPGYSTIMDMSVVGGKALFIPTPGQTEQEYLARKLMADGFSYYVDQDKLDIARDVKIALNFKGFESNIANTNLKGTIDALKITYEKNKKRDNLVNLNLDR